MYRKQPGLRKQRLLKPTAGDVLLNGKSIREQKPENLSRLISMVYQNPEDMFIKDSIGGDIAYAMEVRSISESEKRTAELLARFDFLDLNGKDIAEDRQRAEALTYGLRQQLQIPVVAGSDTHQAVQYGCIRNCFQREFDTFAALGEEMKAGRYSITVHPEATFKVKTAGLLKRSLKEIHALGGDYVSVLLSKGGESPAVLAVKGRTV